MSSQAEIQILTLALWRVLARSRSCFTLNHDAWVGLGVMCWFLWSWYRLRPMANSLNQRCISRMGTSTRFRNTSVLNTCHILYFPRNRTPISRSESRAPTNNSGRGYCHCVSQRIYSWCISIRFARNTHHCRAAKEFYKLSHNGRLAEQRRKKERKNERRMNVKRRARIPSQHFFLSLVQGCHLFRIHLLRFTQ
jgi:hypothetical protein